MNLVPGRAWQHSLWRLLAWLSLTCIVGAVFGQSLVGLCIGLATALCWHYLQLHRLLRLLNQRRTFPPPEGWGVFSAVQERLFKRQLESRRRKQRLQGLLRAFRQAAAALPDAVVVISSKDHRIAWFNTAAIHLLGLRHPNDIGVRITHLLRTPRIVEWFDNSAAEPMLDVDSPLDASLRLSLRIADYSDGQKLLIARDISKLMQLEQVRRDFVANVSHELRTPLTVIHGYLDMLDPDEHPEWASLLAEMRAQSLRMTRIVEDLLTLSRLESHDRLHSEPVCMVTMLQTLRRDAEALSGGRHHIEIEDLAELDLLGSVKELQSAFSNLVSNAVRYTPAGGHITIRFDASPEGGARLTVIDTGPGMAAAHIPRITERFYRISTSRSRETGGTGLGLAIVKHALNLHHAHLDVQSVLGQGSEFRCVFNADHVEPRSTDAMTDS